MGKNKMSGLGEPIVESSVDKAGNIASIIFNLVSNLPDTADTEAVLHNALAQMCDQQGVGTDVVAQRLAELNS